MKDGNKQQVKKVWAVRQSLLLTFAAKFNYLQ